MKLKRTFYLIKCRTHVLLRNLAEKVLKLLAKYDLVIEHKRDFSRVTDLSSPHSLPDLCGNRFVFDVSYVQREIEVFSEYWFTTKKGKMLFVVWDNHHKEGRISYRAELKCFLCHFSPRYHMWVHRYSPVICLEHPKQFSPVSGLPDIEVEFKTHRCDFSQCRYAFEFSYAPDLNANKVPCEVISESCKVLERELTSKVTEINKILTGASYDGELMSPKNRPLSQNLVCNHCGLPVFASAEDKYRFECLHHGELDHGRVRRLDPVQYESVLKNTMDILEALIQQSCPQDSKPLGLENYNKL